jgi:hypothetical protein
MNRTKALAGIACLLAVTWTACNGDDDKGKNRTQAVAQFRTDVPKFSGDSAFAHVRTQVEFGPRVPGTKAWEECADWMASKLRGYGAQVIVQEGEVTAFDSRKLPMKNVIGSFKPEAKNRVLLFAHWDTRPFADKDDERVNFPIDGANDGGSGVGVLLEAARHFGVFPPEVGVDIIMFDVEDYGSPEGSSYDSKAEDWCLGSQYWAKNPHVKGYTARFGILLDMVGAADAVFPKEGTSMNYASGVVRKIWSTAKRLGYGHLFTDEQVGMTIDDHLFVSALANIPSAAIVHYHPEPDRYGYGHFHHTHKDNIEIIDPEVLKAVGQVVLEVVYNEK